MEMQKATKQQCLCLVSADGIKADAKFKRTTHAHNIQFECQRTGCHFSVTISELSEDDDTPETEERLWTIKSIGEHQHDPTENFTPAPLQEHLRAVIAQEAALGLTGIELTRSVSDKIGVDIQPHVTRYIEKKVFKQDHETCWRKLLPMLELLNRSGFPTNVLLADEEDPNSLKFCYVETPFASHWIDSRGFIGVAFLDGAHTTSATKHTMLAVCTVSGDHIIIPLGVAMVDTENNSSYEFMMESMKSGAFNNRSRCTIFSDGHAAINHALEVFRLEETEDGEAKYDYIQAPCLHHMMKRMKGRRAFVDLVRCDHKRLFEVRLEAFKDEHPCEYERCKDVIQLMAYKGSKSIADRCFGFIADSPIESLNGALKKARKEEFYYLIQQFLHWSLEQRDVQLRKLPEKGEELCDSAVNVIRARKRAAADLAVKQITATQYVVLDVFSTQMQLQYTVQVEDQVYTCHCGEYNRSGIPCKHIFATDAKFPRMGRLPAVWDCYTAQSIRDGLRSNAQFTVPAMDDLEERAGDLPAPARPPGRPRTKRLRPISEHIQYGHKIQRKCGYCGEMCHHDKRSCPVRKRNEEERRQLEAQQATTGRRRGRPPRRPAESMARRHSPSRRPSATATGTATGRLSSSTTGEGTVHNRAPRKRASTPSTGPMPTRRSSEPMSTRTRSKRPTAPG